MLKAFPQPFYANNESSKVDKTGAENVHWDLSDLYVSLEDAKLELTQMIELASHFGEKYRGKIGEFDAGGMAFMLVELEKIHDRLGRLYTYAYLWWSTDTGDSDRGAFLQSVKETYSRSAQELLFVDIEWGKVEEDVASKIYADPQLSRYAHYLELVQKQKKHQLSEAEERVVAELSVNGRSAWNRYFDETMGAARFDLGGQQLSQQEVLSKLHEPDRSLRESAQQAFTDGLKENERTLSYVFNTILADKASADRLREYPTWLSSRNSSNEVEDSNVDALIKAVTGRYDISVRYYKLKSKVLGFDQMKDYDRYAPIFETERKISWDEARETVCEAYGDFHPEMGSIVEEFFRENWIDAAVVPGKRGGAFSHGAVPSAHPYILMNYTGRPRDVQTLAHELGHGVHQFLSRKQGVFHADTPLTTAETASVFGEMLTFQSLLKKEEIPKNKLSMLMGKIDDSMATVFRQVSMNRFENEIHTARREEGELNSDQFATMWMRTQQAMFEDSVELTDNYRHWWSYIPHFLHTPGYVYAYAFGELLVFGLYERYLQSKGDFENKYVELLSAGGSDYPHELLKPFDVNLKDPDFWKEGLKAIETWVDEAEQLFESL